MTNDQINGIRDRVAIFFGALAACLGGFGIVDWDTAETALMTAWAAATVVFVGSVVAHFKRGTTTEWVAVGGSLMAFVTTTLTALNAIDVLHWDQSQVELVVGLLAAGLGIFGIQVVRSRVTPYPPAD